MADVNPCVIRMTELSAESRN